MSPATTTSVRDKILRAVGLDPADLASGEIGELATRSPIDGAVIGRLIPTSREGIHAAVGRAASTFVRWRLVPAPKRGELVRLLGEQLRAHKDALAAMVTLETGKILTEAAGEVQEMIDICDFAVGLSRQLYGKTIASERPGHRMMETWHPLGVVGIISAFNFPVAVWSWNIAVALVCGDPVVWKPSEKAPLSALACQEIFKRALRAYTAGSGSDEDWSGLSTVVLGGRDTGAALVSDHRVALVSATGSVPMGRQVGPVVAERFGRVLLELGGNNAVIVAPSADLDLAIQAILFAAVGTAGQRCTTLRRLIVHESIADDLVTSLRRRYNTLPIGDPFDPATMVGPLIDAAALEAMNKALEVARIDGGIVHGGGEILADEFPGACYAQPALVEMPAQTEIVRRETFAPILYVLRYDELDKAIAMHNDVTQGLSSGIFTNDLREAEQFLAAAGSDCGIANVNIGPSGAEVGGAFGGEKETGGGRESGSDSWRSYMRRSTATINFSAELPLAQGVKFSQQDR
ncbi:MAG TPA: aldehyde dehydrogenase family protein [Pseudonocardiaceae bacterium]|jgi:aldehyde dehydrogenase (NAD+)|nr:aldehyde dehydrogenase family protein [Pseudonocardiaceae bacterium]